MDRALSCNFENQRYIGVNVDLLGLMPSRQRYFQSFKKNSQVFKVIYNLQLSISINQRSSYLEMKKNTQFEKKIFEH